MKDLAKIPVGLILEMDDVGWIDGRNLKSEGKATRSGLDRNHCIEDYYLLRDLTKTIGKNVAAAIVVADWDKENVLRGEVGVTHDPAGWDQASKIDIKSHEACLAVLDEGNVDYMLHGVLHGRYDENGACLSECEHLETVGDWKDKTMVRFLESEEDLRRRLDLFFKIFNGWNLKGKVRGFVVPCGACYATEETVEKMCAILAEYGIRYWADSFNYPEFKESGGNLKVYHGVACFWWGRTKLPWDESASDPEAVEIQNTEDAKRKICLYGAHWTNFLNLDPKKNGDLLGKWSDFMHRQGEVFGSMNADHLPQAVNQLFYSEYAKAEYSENQIRFDLTEVDQKKLDCHKNEFFLSVKNEKEPVSIEGGALSLYETHGEFKIYKIEHNELFVTVKFQ